MSSTTVHCDHCGKEYDVTQKDTIRLHEKACLQNPDRRTWPCEMCDRIFPHRSGMLKHNLSRKHKSAEHGATRVTVPLKTPHAPKVHKTSRKIKGAPLLARSLNLVLPRPMDTYTAHEHPLLLGVPSGSFAVIMADPPFRYERRVGSGVADNHYMTMSDDELRALPVGKIASKTCLLLLWCSGPTMTRAAALCEAWGFTYKTVAFVWIKTNKRAEPQSIGLGHYTRPGSEFMLVATKGRGASLIKERPDQVFAAPRTGHSEKPSEMRSLVDTMTGGDSEMRKLELFSRTRADTRWSVWGDQIPEDAEDDEDEDDENSDDGEDIVDEKRAEDGLNYPSYFLRTPRVLVRAFLN